MKLLFKVRLISFILLLFVPLSTSAASVAVLDFELNDLTLNPDLIEETKRTATLRPLLVEQLSVHQKITVIENPASAKIGHRIELDVIRGRSSALESHGKSLNSNFNSATSYEARR